MKRSLASFAAIAVSVGMLSACGLGSSVSADDKAKAKSIAKAGCLIQAKPVKGYIPSPALLPVATLRSFADQHGKAAKKIKEAAAIDSYWQRLADAQFAL